MEMVNRTMALADVNIIRRKDRLMQPAVGRADCICQSRPFGQLRCNR